MDWTRLPHMADGPDRLAEKNFATPGSPQPRRQLLAERMAVGHFFIRGIDATDEGRAPQSRLQHGTFGGGQHLLLAAVRQVVPGMLEALALAKGHQLAVAPPVEALQAILFAPALQGALAEQGQAQQVRAIALVHRVPAGTEKPRQPAPLRRVQARAQLERRVALEHPAQGLPGHAGIGQRRHIAIGQLPAVGEAGLAAQGLLGLHQGHLEALADQGVGTGQADDAATDDANLLTHDCP